MNPARSTTASYVTAFLLGALIALVIATPARAGASSEAAAFASTEISPSGQQHSP